MADIVSSVARLTALCLLLATAATATSINIGRVSRFLGNGSTSGTREGTGFGTTGAFLWRPSGCTFDAAGNFYVADMYNFAVRRVLAGQRTTTTWLGALGDVGDCVGNSGSAVRFGSPVSIKFTPDGSVGFITDVALHKILRVVQSTTQVTLFAGQSSALPGDADGTGTAAAFNQPVDFIIRPTSLDMYVVEQDGNRVRKVTSGAVVTRFAGSATGVAGHVDATGDAARFDRPYSIAVHEGLEQYFVSDRTHFIIRRITAGRAVTTVAGNGTSGNIDGVGAAARFREPWGVAMDSTNTFLYIADKDNNIIRRMDVVTFQVDTVVGDLNANWTAGSNSILARIAAPTSICFLKSSAAQRIYITGDHSVSYVSTRRTRSITLTISRGSNGTSPTAVPSLTTPTGTTSPGPTGAGTTTTRTSTTTTPTVRPPPTTTTTTPAPQDTFLANFTYTLQLTPAVIAAHVSAITGVSLADITITLSTTDGKIITYEISFANANDAAKLRQDIDTRGASAVAQSIGAMNVQPLAAPSTEAPKSPAKSDAVNIIVYSVIGVILVGFIALFVGIRLRSSSGARRQPATGGSDPQTAASEPSERENPLKSRLYDHDTV
jgi:hypothetical protein